MGTTREPRWSFEVRYRFTPALAFLVSANNYIPFSRYRPLKNEESAVSHMCTSIRILQLRMQRKRHVSPIVPGFSVFWGVVELEAESVLPVYFMFYYSLALCLLLIHLLFLSMSQGSSLLESHCAHIALGWRSGARNRFLPESWSVWVGFLWHRITGSRQPISDVHLFQLAAESADCFVGAITCRLPPLGISRVFVRTWILSLASWAVLRGSLWYRGIAFVWLLSWAS